VVKNSGNVGIGTDTPSERLTVNGNIKIEIASRHAATPCFTFARQLDALTSINASRNFNRDGLRFFATTVTMASLTWIINDRPLAIAGRTNANRLDRTEEGLLNTLYLSASVAG
jgi:hypothetical protein